MVLYDTKRNFTGRERKMDDKKIIELFFSRSESAISETSSKYGRLCRKVSYNILHNEEDTEECVNTSYQKLWSTIPPKNPESLCGYLCAIVRNTALNICRRANRRGEDYYEGLSEIIPDSKTVEGAYDSKQIAVLINEFLSKTSKKNRQVFTARYYFGMSVKNICDGYDMSENAVKSRLSRVRAELRSYLTERGVEI